MGACHFFCRVSVSIVATRVVIEPTAHDAIRFGPTPDLLADPFYGYADHIRTKRNGNNNHGYCRKQLVVIATHRILMNQMPAFLHNFISRLTTYSWWVVAIEMLLIGVVVYGVLEFLRGTRGARLIKGTALFLVITYTVIKLGGDKLVRVEFLFSRLLVFTSFAIVVVFQPELRRALMRLGEARLFRLGGSTSRRLIDSLCASAEYCSRNRIGALIAVEREVGLGALIENGTAINADITPELLNTIFWPGSILHDMGVVIRDGRIAAAGVQFPLAEVGELSQEMGSRHRAGLGLSQESDAVIIIVSEETGAISIAERSRLVRGVTPEELRNFLADALRRNESPLLRRPAA